MSDAISKRTRNTFREYLVNFPLRQIDLAFEAFDLTADRDFHPAVTGQRRGLVEQYYRGIDWSSARDVRRVLRVYESLINDLSDRLTNDPQWLEGAQMLANLTRTLASDGFVFAKEKLVSVSGRQHLDGVSDAIAKLDAPELQRQIQRLRDSLESDPALAIGTAKELVESACKTILEERGIEIDAEWDLTRLGKEARECLQLLPSDVPESAKGAETIRKLLGNLGVVVHSLAEVRNLYGTGHGKTAKRQALQPRHAKLAVGAAATLATFLLETHWQRSP